VCFLFTNYTNPREFIIFITPLHLDKKYRTAMPSTAQHPFENTSHKLFFKPPHRPSSNPLDKPDKIGIIIIPIGFFL